MLNMVVRVWNVNVNIFFILDYLGYLLLLVEVIIVIDSLLELNIYSEVLSFKLF